ncbi:hypothetical protein AgCh_011935 [Apium graveolens]
MTIKKYEKKLTELARFVGEYADTDEKRAKRFQQGLRPWLRSNIGALELRTYAEVVQKAMVLEGESEQIQKEKNERKIKFGAEEEGLNRKNQESKNTQMMGFQSHGGTSGALKRRNLESLEEIHKELEGRDTHNI